MNVQKFIESKFNTKQLCRDFRAYVHQAILYAEGNLKGEERQKHVAAVAQRWLTKHGVNIKAGYVEYIIKGLVVALDAVVPADEPKKDNA